MRYKYLLFTFLMIFLFACSSGDKYIGHWESTTAYPPDIIITKAGNAYTIELIYGRTKDDITGIYENGNLISGSVIISYSDGKLIYNGNVYNVYNEEFREEQQKEIKREQQIVLDSLNKILVRALEEKALKEIDAPQKPK